MLPSPSPPRVWSRRISAALGSRSRAGHDSGFHSVARIAALARLLPALLEEAIDLPLLYALQGRDARVMGLALDEIRAMPVQPLSASLPPEPRLRALCTALLEQPASAGSIDAVARQVSMSRSTFTRLFRQETGMGFGAWVTQARLLYALREIAGGASITQVDWRPATAPPAPSARRFARCSGRRRAAISTGTGSSPGLDST